MGVRDFLVFRFIRTARVPSALRSWRHSRQRFRQNVPRLAERLTLGVVSREEWLIADDLKQIQGAG